MAKKTNIPDDVRYNIIAQTTITLLSKTPFDTLGFKGFFAFLRFVYLDTAVSKEKYTGPPDNKDAWWEWRDSLKNEDGNINDGSYSRTKPISYLRKNHPELYNSLTPWLEVHEDI